MTIDQQPTRVLICEDSRTYAAALRRALEHDGTIEVVDIAPSAEQALSLLAKSVPDVITMDIELPGMSGLQGVEQIMGISPCPILIVSSHLGSGSEQTAAALAAGALDAMSKDDLDLMMPTSPSATALRSRLQQLSQVPVIRHPRSRIEFQGNIAHKKRTATIIGICSSTGGPRALAAVLSQIPPTFEVPIVVVQHIARGFTAGFANWLDGEIPLRVRVVRLGDIASAGVWIAPEGVHLQVKAGLRFVMDKAVPAGLHQPSGDILLTSLAAIAGDQAVAVILSGMGRDGTDGAKAIHDASGLVIAQDEESCAVYGMPKAAVEDAGASIVELHEIGPQLSMLHVAKES